MIQRRRNNMHTARMQMCWKARVLAPHRSNLAPCAAKHLRFRPWCAHFGHTTPPKHCRNRDMVKHECKLHLFVHDGRALHPRLHARTWSTFWPKEEIRAAHCRKPSASASKASMLSSSPGGNAANRARFDHCVSTKQLFSVRTQAHRTKQGIMKIAAPSTPPMIKHCFCHKIHPGHRCALR